MANMQGGGAGEGAEKGAVVGAGIGATLGNPLVGAGIGAGFGALFPSAVGAGGVPMPDYTGQYDAYENRLSEIGQFQVQLNQADNSFSAALQNFYSYSMSQFGPNSIPYFQARGLQDNGGAFQAELARQAASYNAQLQPQLYQQQIQNAQMINQAYGGAYSGLMSGIAGGANQQNQLQYMANQNAGAGFMATLQQGVAAYKGYQAGQTPGMAGGVTQDTSGNFQIGGTMPYNPASSSSNMGIFSGTGTTNFNGMPLFGNIPGTAQ